jgi:hypothetical protein
MIVGAIVCHGQSPRLASEKKRHRMAQGVARRGGRSCRRRSRSRHRPEPVQWWSAVGGGGAPRVVVTRLRQICAFVWSRSGETRTAAWLLVGLFRLELYCVAVAIWRRPTWFADTDSAVVAATTTPRASCGVGTLARRSIIRRRLARRVFLGHVAHATTVESHASHTLRTSHGRRRATTAVACFAACGGREAASSGDPGAEAATRSLGPGSG